MPIMADFDLFRILPVYYIRVMDNVLSVTLCVTKAPSINNIDSKCLIRKLKSSRTCLIGYLGFISREWL